MKSAIAVIVLAASVFAESTSKFEVKEIDRSMVQKIELAEEKLSASLVALQSAQESADKAKRERDGIVSSVTSTFGEFDTGCKATAVGSDMGQSFPINYVRSFRKVEIRGKYALITDDKQSCGNSGFIFNNSTSISISPVLGNGTLAVSGQ